MKIDHLDILYIEKAARRRGYSPQQVRAAIKAYETGGRSARQLLFTMGLLPKPPEAEPEMSDEELSELEQELSVIPTEPAPDINTEQDQLPS